MPHSFFCVQASEKTRMWRRKRSTKKNNILHRNYLIKGNQLAKICSFKLATLQKSTKPMNIRINSGKWYPHFQRSLFTHNSFAQIKFTIPMKPFAKIAHTTTIVASPFHATTTTLLLLTTALTTTSQKQRK